MSNRARAVGLHTSRIRLRRPSAGLVVGVLALTVALGGTGYAAFRLPRNTVGTRQLRNGAVGTRKIKNHAVTGAKMAFRGVTVPRAVHANRAAHALTADSATHAATAGSATNATHATTAGSATRATIADTAKTVQPLPSGASESGFYAAAAGNATADWIGDAITYSQPLTTPIANNHIVWNMAGTTSTHCSGYGRADPGYLCLYDNEEHGLSGTTAFYSQAFSSPSAGAILYWFINAADNYVSGEYTVTAP